MKLQDLRSQISIVHQEPVLFPISIAENIAFGRTGATRAEIEQAARDANAHDFIAALPNGYDTVIGERGSTLSGGEQQRIAIARALLKNAPILILDEPTSAVDSATEESIAKALARLIRGQTTFLIAHRLSTVRRANRVLLLQAGRVAELGSFDQLLRGSRNDAAFYGVKQGSEQVEADTGRASP
jgi:ABC-type multidrug transport system fused ATPase/permease subunit